MFEFVWNPASIGVSLGIMLKGSVNAKKKHKKNI